MIVSLAAATPVRRRSGEVKSRCCAPIGCSLQSFKIGGDEMHVGYAPIFQNPGKRLTDREVYRHELKMADLAEPLGFDSIWEPEHHFTDYEMTPDVVQFLTYMAGRTRAVKLGS